MLRWLHFYAFKKSKSHRRNCNPMVTGTTYVCMIIEERFLILFVYERLQQRIDKYQSYFLRSHRQ